MSVKSLTGDDLMNLRINARAFFGALKSLGRELVRWIFTPPDNPRITPIDRIVTPISRITMFLIYVIVLITAYEVTLRYVFGKPTLWVNELSLWLGSVIFLMAGVYTMQRRAHIRITAVYDISPPWLKIVFDIVAALVVVGYAGMMIYGSFGVAWDTLLRWERFGTYWNPPIPATVKPLVLLVTFLVALQAVNNLVIDVFVVKIHSPKREGDSDGDGDRAGEAS